MDPIINDDQARDYFLLRVTKNYKNFHDNIRKKTLNQVKSRWQKINVGVQKFNDHYKQTIDLKRLSYTKNDVMIHAYVIWKKNKESNFTLACVTAAKR